jgi:predicted nucleic acid-binding protein
VNLIDSSAWFEYFVVGPQAHHVSAAIENIDRLLVPTIVLVEVTRRVMQQRDEEAALQIAAVRHQGQIAPLDSGIALSAAHFGVVHKLPLAGSIVFATAKQYDATIWTFDADFRDLPGVKYFSKSK